MTTSHSDFSNPDTIVLVLDSKSIVYFVAASLHGMTLHWQISDESQRSCLNLLPAGAISRLESLGYDFIIENTINYTLSTE